MDLFFVLSGFLVSGLLFKEYKKFGNVKPGLFLIRRGFKIYPLFYLAIALTVFINVYLLGEKLKLLSLFGELVFIQNYYYHFWNHTWSLAIEEHFYFGLTFIVFLACYFRKGNNLKSVVIFCSLIFLICFSLRLYNHLNFEFSLKTHHLPTHLRIDSLLFGVLLSALYQFRKEQFFQFFSRNRTWLLPLSFLMLLPAFIFNPSTLLINTIGITCFYIAFGIVLSVFLTDKSINEKLDKYFSKPIINLVSKIGFYSYSIYLFHMFVKRYLMPILAKYEISPHYRIDFVIFVFLSVVLGIAFSEAVETQTLKIRDKYFPRRSKVF